MNNKIIILVVIGIIIIGGVMFFITNNSGMAVNTPSTNVSQVQTTINPPATTTSSTVPLMQSSGLLFSQYKYFSRAHEIFPILAADTKKALGAFSYMKEDLGNNTYRFTLTNTAEGYKGQSVVVSGDQTVYFIEPAAGDDSTSEDSITTDDILMGVNVQGYILK